MAYIPLRKTAENDNYSISWDSETLCATLWNNNAEKIASFSVGIGEGGKKPYVNSNGNMMVWDETYYSFTMLTDHDRQIGVTVTKINDFWKKDFTIPISKALFNTSSVAKKLSLSHSMSPKSIALLSKGAWFVSQVYHEAPWDIKVENSWNKTIGYRTFPGKNQQVVYHGWLATPEELGNYTYAFIGKSLGFDLPTLLAGSWAAAGLPISGKDLSNEFKDWPAITKGYNAY